jgi:dTMP kinase
MKFPKNPYPGIFIDIEGLDGSGSSTQISLLSKDLKEKGYKVFVTKEPTNNVVGGLIRGVLTNSLQLPADGLQLLFAADRAHHLEREIIPMLRSGSIVITDRYFWSTMAFGSINLPLDWLVELNRFFLVPDATFFIDVSPKTCVERIKKDRFEIELFETEEKLKKVRESYQKIMDRFPKDVEIVNGERSIEEISRDILEKVIKNRKIKGLKKVRIKDPAMI